MSTIWTSKKPDSRSGRRGFAYFVIAGDKSVKYCNRVFTSVKHAKTSFSNRTIEQSFSPDDIANIYDISNDSIVATCYYKPNEDGYKTVLIESNGGDLCEAK